jgi:transcriptional regulator with XRE-family HTH domain
MAKRQAPKLSDQVRQAIRGADCTRYAMAKATGIDQAVLSKFLTGERGMSLESLDKLAEFLNLQITVRKPRKRGK